MGRSIQKFYNLKKPMIIVATVLSVGLYYVGTEFLAPSKNVINTLISPLFTTEYQFFSGNPSGNYFYLGKQMKKSSLAFSSNYVVENIQSGGATDNLLKISSTPRSLGFIQEDTLESALFDTAFVEKNINKIAYLYTEKLHILYWPIAYVLDANKTGVDVNNRKHLILKHKDSNGSLDASILEDASKLNQKSAVDSLYYLSNPKIKVNLGTENSGSRFIAHALLNSAGVTGFEEREFNDSLSAAMEKFLKREIHVLFFFTGSPLDKMKEPLAMGAKLMGVKAVDFIKTMNQDYSILTRPAKFGDEYEHAKNIGTIGSRATLIASSDVSSKALVEIISNFKMYIDPPGAGDDSSRLIEFGGKRLPISKRDLNNTLAMVKAKYSKTKEDLLRNILLFLVAWAAGTLLVLKIINGIISSLKKHRYFKEIQKIAKLPKVFANHQGNSHELIEVLFAKQHELQALMEEISDDYRMGGITDDAMIFLEERIEKSIERIRLNIKTVLIQSNYEEVNAYTDHKELIAELLAHGFIDSTLADKWSKKEQPC